MARKTFALFLLFWGFLLTFLMDESSAGLLDGHPIAGPCDVIIKKIESCPKKISGQNGFRFTNIKTYKSKDHPTDYVMSANLTLDFSIDDTIMAAMSLAEWTERGGWRSNAHKINIHQMCSTFATMASKFWKKIVEAFYGRPMPCPLPPFKNRPMYKNITFEADDFFVKEFFYGKSRNDLIFVHQASGAVKGCLRTTAEVVPKKSP